MRAYALLCIMFIQKQRLLSSRLFMYICISTCILSMIVFAYLRASRSSTYHLLIITSFRTRTSTACDCQAAAFYAWCEDLSEAECRTATRTWDTLSQQAKHLHIPEDIQRFFEDRKDLWRRIQKVIGIEVKLESYPQGRCSKGLKVELKATQPNSLPCLSSL